MDDQGQLTVAFGVGKGFIKDGALFAVQFSTVLEKVSWNKETNRNGTIFNITRQYK